MEEISVVVCLELHASWVNDERTGSYTALYYTSGALKQLSVTHIHISINPLESNLGLVSRPRMFGMETGAHRDQTTATAMRCKRSQESWWVSMLLISRYLGSQSVGTPLLTHYTVMG